MCVCGSADELSMWRGDNKRVSYLFCRAVGLSRRADLRAINSDGFMCM